MIQQGSTMLRGSCSNSLMLQIGPLATGFGIEMFCTISCELPWSPFKDTMIAGAYHHEAVSLARTQHLQLQLACSAHPHRQGEQKVQWIMISAVPHHHEAVSLARTQQVEALAAACSSTRCASAWLLADWAQHAPRHHQQLRGQPGRLQGTHMV
jgi:hypothetical protein